MNLPGTMYRVRSAETASRAEPQRIRSTSYALLYHGSATPVLSTHERKARFHVGFPACLTKKDRRWIAKRRKNRKGWKIADRRVPSPSEENNGHRRLMDIASERNAFYSKGNKGLSRENQAPPSTLSSTRRGPRGEQCFDAQPTSTSEKEPGQITMFRFTVVLAIALASCQAFVPIDGDLEDELVDLEEMFAVQSDELVSFLESFKKTMRTGDPKTGVPLLDPLLVEQIPVNVKNDYITLKGNMQNYRVAGLSNYHVLKGDFSKKNLTADVTLVWDSIAIKTDYKVNGHVKNIDVSGNGVIRVVSDLKVLVKTKLVEKDNKMAVSSLTFNAYVNRFPFSITGLHKGASFSEKISRLVTKMMPHWVENHQKEVSKHGGAFVKKMLNSYLKHFTLKDFLKLIQA